MTFVITAPPSDGKANTRHDAGLVDVYRLIYFPGVVGTGARLSATVQRPRRSGWTAARSWVPAGIQGLRAFATTDLTADLRRIDIPVLVVLGDADASAPIDITGRPTAELLTAAAVRFTQVPAAPRTP